MKPRARHASLTMFIIATAVDCVCTEAEPPPAEPAIEAVGSQGDGTTRYYRSFDKLTLTGIDELSFTPFSVLNSSIGYPHVAITPGAADEWRVVTAAASHDCRASRRYERHDGHFVWREIFDEIETEWEKSERVCHIVDGAEHCYLYQIIDSGVSTQRALLSFSRETQAEKIEYSFLTALSTSKLVDQIITFRSNEPLPASVLRKALYVETTIYTRGPTEQVTHETTTMQHLEDGQPDGPPEVRERDLQPKPVPRYIREALSDSNCILDE